MNISLNGPPIFPVMAYFRRTYTDILQMGPSSLCSKDDDIYLLISLLLELARSQTSRGNNTFSFYTILHTDKYFESIFVILLTCTEGWNKLEPIISTGSQFILSIPPKSLCRPEPVRNDEFIAALGQLIDKFGNVLANMQIEMMTQLSQGKVYVGSVELIRG